MAVAKIDGFGTWQAPQADAKQPPKAEAKKPQQNAATAQLPKETQAAVKNTFGDLPAEGNAKPANDAPAAPAHAIKLPVTAPKEAASPKDAAKAPAGKQDAPKTYVSSKQAPADAKTPAAAETNTASPVAPLVQSILNTGLGDNKTVKEKLDADASFYMFKASQDHYNKQVENGEALDSVSKFYLNHTAKYIAENGVKADDITPDKLADVFDMDKINKNIEEAGKDPDFLKWSGEQQANAIENTAKNNPEIAKLIQPYLLEGENYVNALRRMQSEYLGSQEFADSVATAKTTEAGKTLVNEGLKALASLGMGEKEMLGVANALSENIRNKYAPDTPKMVIDPNTNKPVQTEDGHNLATLTDGTHIAIGADGRTVTDKLGGAYVYNQDGSAKLDAGKAYMQYDGKSRSTYASYDGIKYMVGPDGQGKVDAQGQPLIIDNDGGAPVALGANGKVAVDAQGNKAVINPASGKQVVDPDSGNKVVIDARSKGIVQAGADGKVVAGANGDPYAADQKTGAFVKDSAGRYVLISKENAAPGIVPGYVVDAHNTKIVVSPVNGKPLVDPGSGKTVIFTPGTNAPALVPLDAAGKPLLSEDGWNVVYDKGGSTVVRGTGSGPNWLVDANGKYVGDGNGHYIGVGQKNGMAHPVDASGKPMENSDGRIPLWDPKTNAMMVTADGQNHVVLDKSGALLAASPEGHVGVESQTGLPFLIDPKTMSVAVNPDTGRWIMLDKSGSAVEYNADDGYKYLINPKTNTTVKTAEGQVIVIDDAAAMPVGVNADGSKVRNPDTGNTVVYDLDGKAAVDGRIGGKIEITPDGKAHAIDPKTQAPVGTYDKSTGGTQLYNKDGSELLDPATGNKVQLDPNGHHVEVDATNGKFATDAFGNTLILGPDNSALKMPNGNAVVVDKQTGSPIGVDAAGKVEVDPDSKLPRAINTETGKALEDPTGKASVVVDPKSGAPIHVDPGTGAPMVDPVTGLTIVANAKTGEQAKGPNGEPIGVLPGYKFPVYYDTQNNALVVVDPQTGKKAGNPKTGAEIIIDPVSGVPVQILPDKDGNLLLVDNYGRPREDGKGNLLYLDKASGHVTIKLPDGKIVDAATGKEPEKADPKKILKSIPTPPPLVTDVPAPGKEGGDSVPDSPADVDPPTMPGSPPPEKGTAGANGSPDIPLDPPEEIPFGLPGTSKPTPPPQNQATVTAAELPDLQDDVDAIFPDPVQANPDVATVPVASKVTTTAAKAVSKWKSLGVVAGGAADVFSAGTGILQAIAGGLVIEDGVKNNNPYDIASGVFNVVSGVLNASSSAASLVATFTSVGSTLILPLAAAAFAAGTIATFIDFANSLDDDEQFADELAKKYEQLGILKEGWRPKAEAAHRDGYSEYYQPNYQG